MRASDVLRTTAVAVIAFVLGAIAGGSLLSGSAGADDPFAVCRDAFTATREVYAHTLTAIDSLTGPRGALTKARKSTKEVGYAVAELARDFRSAKETGGFGGGGGHCPSVGGVLGASVEAYSDLQPTVAVAAKDEAAAWEGHHGKEAGNAFTNAKMQLPSRRWRPGLRQCRGRRCDQPCGRRCCTRCASHDAPGCVPCTPCTGRPVNCFDLPRFTCFSF
jgi:hypothetical protein